MAVVSSPEATANASRVDHILIAIRELLVSEERLGSNDGNHEPISFISKYRTRFETGHWESDRSSPDTLPLEHRAIDGLHVGERIDLACGLIGAQTSDARKT